MLKYTTDRAGPGLVALYDIRPGNGAGLFSQPRIPNGPSGFPISLPLEIPGASFFTDRSMSFLSPNQNVKALN